MEINIQNDGLLIMPQTEFEEQWISRIRFRKMNVYVKSGLTPAEIVGLKIDIGEEMNDEKTRE